MTSIKERVMSIVKSGASGFVPLGRTPDVVKHMLVEVRLWPDSYQPRRLDPDEDMDLSYLDWAIQVAEEEENLYLHCSNGRLRFFIDTQTWPTSSPRSIYLPDQKKWTTH